MDFILSILQARRTHDENWNRAICYLGEIECSWGAGGGQKEEVEAGGGGDSINLKADSDRNCCNIDELHRISKTKTVEVPILNFLNFLNFIFLALK